MKKMTKSMLLSLLMATTFATTVAAAAISIDNAKATESNAVVETADFRMVDGASIRMASPLGLRFIAEMTDDVYEDLITAESGVDKKMGMFIAPYSYFDGYVGKYQDVATKLDLVFYDSTGAVENKIYSDTENGETVYRANGVITDLYLKNYSRDFVGIAYIAETTGGKTTYTYADFNAEDNVRNAAYVAIEAYEDYTDAAPRAVFSQYVWGAHLYDNGMTESNGTYTYNGKEYASIEAAAAGLDWSILMDKYAYVKAGECANINATVTADGKTVDFSGMHINFSSSNESILTINDNGVMTAKGNGIVTVTASFMGKTATCQVIAGAIDFEDGKTPSWFTGARVASFTTTDMYGGKVMEVKSTSDAYGDICVIMPRDTIGAFFANSDVDYFAFDLKLPADATTVRSQVLFKGGSGSFNPFESGEYDTAPIGTFKTYYIARATYEQWIANGVTDTRILNVAKGVMNGMSLYIDNVRGVSAEERIEEWYSFESGGVRTNNGNQPLLYMSGGNQWELGFSNINSATAGFTSEIVSDGNRAFQFTKYSGDTKISLNHNTDTDREKELRAAGYFSFDVYVPAGANATIKWGNYSGGTLKTGWNTVYVQVDATNNDLILLSDTTGSTYVIDNIQMVTEEEYFENAYGFENGGATLRTSGSEADNYAGTFYVYMGADRRKNVYSIAATGSVSNPRISSENVYDGDYSLAFDKSGDLNLQFRADSATYAALRNGFSFWIYSTIGVNGTSATNLRNGNSQKLNGGAGMNISKNTWTKITLTKDDIVQGSGEAGCSFLKIVGSTNGTYYIDGIEPLPASNTVTLVDGDETKTQSVYKGVSYSLPVPTTYAREFLGWYDANGNKVATSGVWMLEEDVTLTARYSEVKAIDFEDGVLPTYLTRAGGTESLSVVDLNGNKVLKMQGSASGTSHILNVPLAFLTELFADPTIQYVAFDVKSETTQTTNFRRSTIRTTGTVGSWGQEPYEADIIADNTNVMGIRPDAFKTFFFTRTDYNNWVSNNITTEMLITTSGYVAGESLYVDNIRPVTQAEYNKANYGFETGGIRPNGGNLLVYYANTGSTWQYAITSDSVDGVKPTFSSFGYTNDDVTEGNRALTFTKTAGQVTLRFNSTSVANFVAIANATGYYAFDLYVGAGSDVVLTYPNFANSVIPGVEPNVGGWMTIYCQNDTNVCVILKDTTGGTYAIDNFRSVSSDDFQDAQYGFEAGTVGLRLNLLNDANTYSGAAYIYNKGTDYSGVTASLSIGEGNSANDVNAVSNVRIAHDIVHSGTSSLAFDKGNGYVALSRHANSQALKDFAGGFSFWMYSTVDIDATTTKFINGVNAKFNDGLGMYIPANTWTKIVVKSEDIGNGRFLIMQGNWSGTIYLDDFQLIDWDEFEQYTITYDAGVGSVDANTQTVYYGAAYQLKTPSCDRDFLGWIDEDGNLFPESGIWYLTEDVVLTAIYAEPPQHYYNAVAEWEENGGVVGLTLGASTYVSSSGDGALPQPNKDTNSEDMSYYRFSGNYGLNDFLVFDFTGNNMPILSFFNNSVTNTIYNHAQDANVKGWLVTNGMYVKTGLPYGGFAGAHANRVTLIGPYNISYTYDNNGENQSLAQVRTSIGSAADPSPITMASLNANDQYRVIIGWVENGNNMNLRVVAWNMTTGVQLVNYNQGGVPKADWTGDIVLYGHYSRETYVDHVYPIAEGLDAALALYTPDMLAYKAEWDGNGVTLAASTYAGNVSYPTSADMSYLAFNGKYGSGDYVVFDFTGSNMPIVSFFNNTITNTMYNNNGTGSTATVKDANVAGWIWANGLYNADGSIYGGETGAHASRLALIGKQKVIGYDQGTNGFRVNLGSASDIHPLSIRALQDVTDTYRMIIGIRANGANKVYVDMAAINMVTGALVYSNSWEVSTAISADGSIILYGQFGKTTVLDSVLGIEEDTNLETLIAKYAKDVDYSDEAAVTLDRYGYSSITNGQWTVDGTNQESNPTDYRELQATYDTYAASGLNIMLAQSAFSTDKSGWENTSRYMDMAAKAGLKVILTDWHIQLRSAPLKAGSKGVELTTSSEGYGPWVLASDLNADGTGKTQAVQDYLNWVAAAGLTIDKTTFKDQNALDAYLMGEIKHYKDHPAFYGVMLADEPSYHNAYCYGKVYQSLKRIAPDMYVQYNLLPLEQNLSTIQYRYPGLSSNSSLSNAQVENAYKAYVTGFIDAMGTDYIQYDDYPFKSAEEGFLIWKDTVPYVDNTALRNIQLIAEIAAERGLDVKVVTQTALMHTGGQNGPVHIRKITEADARWLNNYLMGFGVKQINYFTYWTKASNSSSGEWYDDGGSFVNRDGSTTEVYNIMKAIMADNDKFAPTISNFNYSDSHVYGTNNDSNLNNDHIDWSSSLTDSNYSFKWLTNVTTSKEYTLVTELYDEENYNYMYMVMNTIDTYYGGTQSVTVTLDSNVASFYVYNPNGTRTLVSGNTYSVSLTAGQAIYIMPAQING